MAEVVTIWGLKLLLVTSASLQFPTNILNLTHLLNPNVFYKYKVGRAGILRELVSVNILLFMIKVQINRKYIARLINEYTTILITFSYNFDQLS